MNRVPSFFSYLASLPPEKLEKVGPPLVTLSEEEMASLTDLFLSGVSMALKNYQVLQEQQKKENLAYILISPLRASIVTQTYEMMITAFDENMYLNTATAVGYFTPTHLFNQMDRHMDVFKGLLQEKFIRIQPYELDELRQQYALELAQLLLHDLPDLIPRMMQIECYHQIQSVETVTVLFGLYLDQVTPLFPLTKEKL